MAEEKLPQIASTDPTDIARVFAEIALRSKHLVESHLAAFRSALARRGRPSGGGDGTALSQEAQTPGAAT